VEKIDKLRESDPEFAQTLDRMAQHFA
jgi:hypothetical protein